MERIYVYNFLTMFMVLRYLKGNRAFDYNKLCNYVLCNMEEDNLSQEDEWKIYEIIINYINEFIEDGLLLGVKENPNLLYISGTINVDYIVNENKEYLEAMTEFCNRFQYNLPSNVIVTFFEKEKNR